MSASTRCGLPCNKSPSAAPDASTIGPVRSWLAPVALALLGAGGCAGGTGSAPDARPADAAYFDAPGPDAALSISLNETADTTVNGGPTACIDSATDPDHGNTYDNTWYRAFQLSDFPDIHGGMHVSTIVFAVASVKNAGAVTVNIGSYSGTVGGATLDLTQVTPLASTMVYPQDSGSQELSVPLDANIPPGGKFVVSVAAPSFLAQGYFFLGGTTAAETYPGFWTSTACGFTTPLLEDKNQVSSHMIITVVGTH